jgi:hypothetical protein
MAKSPQPQTPAAGSVLTDQEEIAATLVVGCEVAVQKELSPERQWANLAGWLPGRGLILDGPRSLVTRGALFRGNPVTLRYLNLGVLYGFAGRVEQVVREPLMVVVGWPERLEVMALGAEPRAAAKLPAGLSLLHPGGRRTDFAATLEDLSRSGCRLRVERTRASEGRLEPGARVEVRLALPGSDEPAALAAEVRNSLTRESFIGLGLKFDTEGQDDRLAAVARVVERQLM